MWKISLKMLCLKYKQSCGASTFFSPAPAPSKKVYRLWLPIDSFFTGSGSIYILFFWLPIHSFSPALAPYTFFFTRSGSLYILFYPHWLPIHSFLPALAPGTYFQEIFPAPTSFILVYGFLQIFFLQLWLPLKRPGSQRLFLGGFPALDSILVYRLPIDFFTGSSFL